ncbi:unnamed protein product [Prorocentrum cordatum]|uniref:Uncharacterized protein n=1 Tax=Prorocentrum cordatum TaxID=2364126 RepID=A0ABN9R130_9DINO|nr:unnamed protein product [Polarella glacialis]
MAAAGWPHFVPRAELDVELRELRGRLEQVVRSVAGLEGRAGLSEDALGELRARCRDELATRLALGGVESRLEVDIGICRQESSRRGCSSSAAPLASRAPRSARRPPPRPPSGARGWRRRGASASAWRRPLAR